MIFEKVLENYPEFKSETVIFGFEIVVTHTQKSNDVLIINRLNSEHFEKSSEFSLIINENCYHKKRCYLVQYIPYLQNIVVFGQKLPV